MQGPVTVAASAKLGKVIDLAWVPLPAPIGGGSVIVVAGEDGSLAVVDATQTVEHRSLKKRLAAFKNLVGGRWPFPQVLLRRKLSRNLAASHHRESAREGRSTSHFVTYDKAIISPSMA